MTIHNPQLSAAAALLLIRSGTGISLRATSRELAGVHKQLTGEDTDPNEIQQDLRGLAKQMAASGFLLWLDDAPDLTDETGRVLG